MHPGDEVKCGGRGGEHMEKKELRNGLQRPKQLRKINQKKAKGNIKCSM